MSAAGTLAPTTPDALGEEPGEFERPPADGLIGDVAPSSSDEVLDVSKTQREPEVDPNGALDDLRRKAMSGAG